MSKGYISEQLVLQALCHSKSMIKLIIIAGFVLPVYYEIPGVFQGMNKNVEDPIVGNFTSIFFRTSYLKSESVCM